MPDLHGWITQQIDKTAHQAERAAELQALEWSCPSTGVVDFGDDLIATGDRDVAYHIALNDPAAVLRRCAADRKILAEHAPQPDGSSSPDIQQCRTCSSSGDVDDWYQYLVPYPCPTVLAVAEGYGFDQPEPALRGPNREGTP